MRGQTQDPCNTSERKVRKLLLSRENVFVGSFVRVQFTQPSVERLALALSIA